ncbi:hypothetical protein [Pleomorphovibrio marinus]|uniref:hypothetical protein n=1 Tax=Pleomorphovibrio marinus TaxID=2164132 RepID=UPI000E0A63A2|nr:hypothetical protein [Pleomorphovibrio marinus]
MLSVTSDVEDHLGAFGDGKQFDVVEDTIYSTNGYLLKLGSGSMTRNPMLTIEEGVMEINDSPLDGPVLTLIRVE